MATLDTLRSRGSGPPGEGWLPLGWLLLGWPRLTRVARAGPGRSTVDGLVRGCWVAGWVVSGWQLGKEESKPEISETRKFIPSDPIGMGWH